MLEWQTVLASANLYADDSPEYTYSSQSCSSNEVFGDDNTNMNQAEVTEEEWDSRLNAAVTSVLDDSGDGLETDLYRGNTVSDSLPFISDLPRKAGGGVLNANAAAFYSSAYGTREPWTQQSREEYSFHPNHPTGAHGAWGTPVDYTYPSDMWEEEAYHYGHPVGGTNLTYDQRYESAGIPPGYPPHAGYHHGIAAEGEPNPASWRPHNGVADPWNARNSRRAPSPKYVNKRGHPRHQPHASYPSHPPAWNQKPAKYHHYGRDDYAGW
ncbi:hypothetical protein DIPPA_27791 [Diplonema papillatum]|nr:hypothetical protein DIPPA_27791 [Diplonema papillatum]